MDKNLVLISSAVLFKEKGKKDLWFLIKQSDEIGWEFPKTVVRKGESSVRASIRMIGEQGSINARVLEEAGRAGGVTTVNDKTLPQRHIYYLMREISETKEAIGFEEFEWIESTQAMRKLTSKREKAMLREARKELEVWRKKKPNQTDDMEEDVFVEG